MFHSLDSEELFAVFDFKLLSDHLRVIRIELPAHGSSPLPSGPERLAWPSIAEDIRMLAGQITDQPYFAGGFSQGAGIIACMAAENRNMAGLVMMMLPKIWGMRPAIRKTYAKLATRLEKEGDKEILERLFNLTRYVPEHLEQNEETAAGINSLMLGMSPEAIRMILSGAIMSDMPDPEILKKSGIPSLLGAWDQDPNHPYSVYEELVRQSLATDHFEMNGSFGIKPATFRLLSFIFTYL
jgi:pimeloyl-ACP methyl ester carboxylesterase